MADLFFLDPFDWHPKWVWLLRPLCGFPLFAIPKCRSVGPRKYFSATPLHVLLAPRSVFCLFPVPGCAPWTRCGFQGLDGREDVNFKLQPPELAKGKPIGDVWPILKPPCSVALFLPLFLVAAPRKNCLPQKGFAFFPGSLNN